jgi:hypothetical protein
LLASAYDSDDQVLVFITVLMPCVFVLPLISLCNFLDAVMTLYFSLIDMCGSPKLMEHLLSRRIFCGTNIKLHIHDEARDTWRKAS